MVLYKMKKAGSGKVAQIEEITAGLQQIVVTPDEGAELKRVTVFPQQHTETIVVTTKSSSIDMGEHHKKRYIDTSNFGLKRTTLWENSAPASNFAAQAVELGISSQNDYDYYEIIYKPSTAESDSTNNAIFDKDALKDGDNYRCAFGGKSSNWYNRMAYFASTTALQITTAYQTSSTSTSTAKLIPLKINGLKY